MTEEVSGLEMISVTTTGLGLGTNNPSARLEVIGRTKTGSLEITAGSDVAEPFETETEEVVEPGSVMVIDAVNPGKLKLSERRINRVLGAARFTQRTVCPALIVNLLGEKKFSPMLT